MRSSRTAFRILCSVLLAVSAQASDGVLEISQTCADTPGQGCFAGDAPGFPVTLAQPGSYRLTSNLVVPVDTSGLRIEADGVSIDLNGFRVVGPFACPLPCFSATGSGVQSAAGLGNRVSISNGEISGFGLDGVNLRTDALVERLLVTNAGRHGIVIASGSIALANRIRRVGDDGLRMTDSAQLGAPIYRDNVISEANLAGAGASAVSGGRATGGNACSDGSCSVSAARRFYLTTTRHQGADALNACAPGFHMASYWEIRETAALRYDHVRGYRGFDSGFGPPAVAGFIRTGAEVDLVTNSPGAASCRGWTSVLATERGSSVALGQSWTLMPVSSILPWNAGNTTCESQGRVWCVEH